MQTLGHKALRRLLSVLIAIALLSAPLASHSAAAVAGEGEVYVLCTPSGIVEVRIDPETGEPVERKLQDRAFHCVTVCCGQLSAKILLSDSLSFTRVQTETRAEIAAFEDRLSPAIFESVFKQGGAPPLS